MSSRAARTAGLVGVLVFIAIGAYWYWSPVLAMRSMKAAAEARDADRFNQYVDYAKLRESLKGQFAAQMAGTLESSGKSGSDMEKAGAALGTMLGMAFMDSIIEAMVRPEMVMRAMNEAKMRPDTKDRPAETSTKNDEVRWVVERKGVDRVIAYGLEAGNSQAAVEEGVGFVFDRGGFADWKLTEIRLPAGK